MKEKSIFPSFEIGENGSPPIMKGAPIPARLYTCFSPSHKWLGKKSSLKENKGIFSYSRKERFSIFFFVVPRKFYEFSGDPTSAVENRLRFSTAEERFLRFLRNRRKTRVFLRFRRNRRKTALGIRENGSPPIPGPLRFQRNLRGRPFFRFQRNRKERQDFIPSAPQGQRKKTRESEETTEKRSKIFFPRKEKSSIFLF